MLTEMASNFVSSSDDERIDHEAEMKYDKWGRPYLAVKGSKARTHFKDYTCSLDSNVTRLQTFVVVIDVSMKKLCYVVLQEYINKITGTVHCPVNITPKLKPDLSSSFLKAIVKNRTSTDVKAFPFEDKMYKFDWRPFQLKAVVKDFGKHNTV
jgi:hypothetical protein